MSNGNQAASANELDPQRPFMGLDSFEEKHQALFGGRDTEIEELYKLVESSGLTVVFGKSGIGKTSLLKAGLMPRLRHNYFFPIYLRIDYNSKKTPLEQVKAHVYDTMVAKDPNVTPVGEATLWQYFHDVDFKNGYLTPVLIFDQFEETFTIGDSKMRDVLELVVELADLAENRIPLVVQQEYLKKEEIIPSRYSKRTYRLVLSLREDYLARLDELIRYIPSILDNRFRVLQMTIDQAMDAAIKPGKALLEKEIAQEIIKKFDGVSQADFDLLEEKGTQDQKLKVEPFLLSLICYSVNEKRIESNLDTITTNLVSQFNVKDVIGSFYNDTVSKYGKVVERAIEDNLLTEGGFRKLQALEGWQKKYTISKEVIDGLVGSRILRRENRDKLEYVELIHDVLAPIIKENRELRIQKEKKEEEQRFRQEKLVEEKKKAEAREVQIRLEEKRKRKKSRRTLIIGFSTVLGILVAMVFFKIYSEGQEIKKRNEDITLAIDLTARANGVRLEDDSYNPALLARAAYLIYKKDKSDVAGEYIFDEFFYSSMYKALRDNKFYFVIAKFDYSVELINKLKLQNGGNEYVLGLKDGNALRLTKDKIDRQSGNAEGIDSLKNFQRRRHVTSMVLKKNKNKNLLYTVGRFDSIIIHDLDAENLFQKIRIPGSKNVGKSLEFLDNGRFIVRQRESIVGWDSIHGAPFKWHKRSEQNYYNEVQNDTAINVNWDQPELTIPGIKFYCSAVSNSDSSLAIGIDSGLIVLNKEKLIQLKYADVGRISAIKYHPSGEYLILGNYLGEIFHISMKDYRLTSHFPHTRKITDIAFNTDGTMLATASNDGQIVIWDTKNWNSEYYNWLPLNPRNTWTSRSLGTVNCISFTPDGDYVLAGYGDGTLLRWPVSMNMLADLICESAGETQISEEDWVAFGLKKYSINEYTCIKN